MGDSARSVSVLHHFKGRKPGRHRNQRYNMPDEADPHGVRDKSDAELEFWAIDYVGALRTGRPGARRAYQTAARA